MLSQSLAKIELRLGLGKGSKTVLGYTHVVDQLSFSMFPSFLTLYFNLILWALWRVEVGIKNCFEVSLCS